MSDDEYMRSLEIQRRNFEAQFGSLEDMGFEDKSKEGKHDTSSEESDEMESDEEDVADQFAGFSGDLGAESLESEPEEEEEELDEEPKPKVIKLNEDFSSTPILSKKDQKLVRQGRAPTLKEISEKVKVTEAQAKINKQEDDDNLENDMKLQRLLQESHILSNHLEYSGADVTLQTLDYEEPTGKARKKALTSRLRNISSTNSATEGLPKRLEKMPMSMRKGMIKSREKRIAKYEQEAKDAGIILSKVRKGELRQLDAGRGSTFSSDRLGTGKKAAPKIRDKGLQINSVGRSTRNGLVISQAEIDKINGKSSSKGKSAFNGKKRRR